MPRVREVSIQPIQAFSDLKARVAHLEQQLFAAQQLQSMAEGRLHQETISNQRQVADLNAKIFWWESKNRNDVECLRIELESLHDTNRNLGVECQTLQGRVSTLMAEKGAMAEESLEQTKNARMENRVLQTDKANLTNELKQTKSQLARSEANTEDHQRHMHALQTYLDTYKVSAENEIETVGTRLKMQMVSFSLEITCEGLH